MLHFKLCCVFENIWIFEIENIGFILTMWEMIHNLFISSVLLVFVLKDLPVNFKMVTGFQSNSMVVEVIHFCFGSEIGLSM